MAQNIHPSMAGMASVSSAGSEAGKEATSRSGGPNSSHVSKRLQQELMSLMMSCDRGISAFPDGDRLFSWIATVQGPKDSVYEGLSFKLRLEFPDQYPYTAPTVRFTSPCYHPNVDQYGNICLDILKEKWSALYEVRTILLSIQTLLGDPNNESPLNTEAAGLWANQTAFKKKVLELHSTSS